MLLVGSYRMLNLLRMRNLNVVVYNLNSPIEGYPRLTLMPMIVPDKEEEDPFGIQFDIEYAKEILEDDSKFLDMMTIMMNIWNDINVYLIVSTGDDYYDIITESFLKFIQQRYKVNAFIIAAEEDLDTIETADPNDFSFDIYGINNFDIDKERFTRLFYHEMVEADGVDGILRGVQDGV